MSVLLDDDDDDDNLPSSGEIGAMWLVIAVVVGCVGVVAR